jgi:hypothetical protein
MANSVVEVRERPKAIEQYDMIPLALANRYLKFFQ